MLLNEGGRADRWVYLQLYAGDRPLLSPLARLFTFLGEPTLLVVSGLAICALLWFLNRRSQAVVLVAVILSGRALAEIQKVAFARPRPAIEPHLVVTKTFAFPSGHAANSMIFYLMLALILTKDSPWRLRAALGAIALSLLIGVSRVMLGVHWPSDVIGGWAFGALWVLLTLKLAGRLIRE